MTEQKNVRQREYTKKFYDKRRAEGWSKSDIWLQPDGREAMETAIKLTGQQKHEVVNKALVMFADSLTGQRE